MAYATVPGRRMAYDADGTVLVMHRYSYQLFEWDATHTAYLNDEDMATNVNYDPLGQFNNHSGEMIWIFPELREIDGFFGLHSDGTTDRFQEVATSANTTNGIDGTHSTLIANWTDVAKTTAAYRTDITSASASSKRSVRLQFTNHRGVGFGFRSIHLYGEISAGETPDRLLFINVATGLEFTVPQDWGDIPRGTTHDKTIRIKNNSSTLTANTITLSFEDLYLGSSSWYTIKETGGSFSTTLGITSIAAGVTYPTPSNVITIRKATPDDETLGLHAARCKATTTSWT